MLEVALTEVGQPREGEHAEAGRTQHVLDDAGHLRLERHAVVVNRQPLRRLVTARVCAQTQKQQDHIGAIVRFKLDRTPMEGMG